MKPNNIREVKRMVKTHLPPTTPERMVEPNLEEEEPEEMKPSTSLKNINNKSS
jgi:hypothetical protein